MLKIYVLTSAVFLAFSLSRAAVASDTQQSVHLVSARSAPTSGQQFLKKELAELLDFKNSRSFAEYGFGLGGPHNKWLQLVNAHRHDSSFSNAEQFAVNQLSSLGMEYMHHKGAESDISRLLKSSIRKAIKGQASNS